MSPCFCFICRLYCLIYISATAIADKLGIEFALIHRSKKDGGPDRMHILVGDVKDKVAILIDDMIDTGHTLSLATRALKDGGAKSIYALISHGQWYLLSKIILI